MDLLWFYFNKNSTEHLIKISFASIHFSNNFKCIEINAVCLYLPHILRSLNLKKYGIQVTIEGNLLKLIYVGIVGKKIVSTV